MTPAHWLFIVVALQISSFWLFTRKGRTSIFSIPLITASIIFGALSYFFFGFPLDEGTLDHKEENLYQFGFGLTIMLLITQGVALLYRWFFNNPIR